MKNQFSLVECKIIWVVGALERLATLGMLNSNVPLKLSSETVDDFVEIDQYRNFLFESDFEISSIFNSIANVENENEGNFNEMESIVRLILEYKNHRTELVKHALESSLHKGY